MICPQGAPGGAGIRTWILPMLGVALPAMLSCIPALAKLFITSNAFPFCSWELVFCVPKSGSLTCCLHGEPKPQAEVAVVWEHTLGPHPLANQPDKQNFYLRSVFAL